LLGVSDMAFPRSIGLFAVLCFACGGAAQTSSPDTSAPNALEDAGTGADTGVKRDDGVALLLASLDESCPWSSNATGRSILEHVKSPYQATYSPISGSRSNLTVSLTFAAGEIRCHPQITNTTGGAPDTPAWIEVTVDMGLATADGVFVEKVPAKLRRTYSSGDSLEASTTIATSTLAGTFKAAGMPGFDDISLIISGYFDFDGKTHGHIQQVGQKSSSPSSGTNASVTRPVGDWE